MYRPIALLHRSALVVKMASSAILQSLQKHDHFQHSFHFSRMYFPLLSSTYNSAQQASVSANDPFIGRPTPQLHESGKCMKMTSLPILKYLSKQAYFHLFLWTCLFFADFIILFMLLFCQEGHKMRGYEEKKMFSFRGRKLCCLKE